MDLLMLVPNSTPPRLVNLVNGQPVSLLLVGIFNKFDF